MDYELAKDLADTISSMWRTTDDIYAKTGWEIAKNFPEISAFFRIFIKMVGGTIDDYSFEKFGQYVDGEIDYATLLNEVRMEEIK